MRLSTFALGYLALLSACGGRETGAPAALRRPPAPASSAVTAEGSRAVFAIRSFVFGDTGANGAYDFKAWKDLGFDLDGVASSRSANAPCRLRSGVSNME